MAHDYATKSGLKIHTEKVRAVLEMPRPTDVKRLLRFNGTVPYLAKVLPRVSVTWPIHFVSCPVKMPSGSGQKPRREHGVI